MHINENANRKQATTAEGEERFDVLKYKAGGYVVKKVKVEPTFSMLLCGHCVAYFNATQLILYRVC